MICGLAARVFSNGARVPQMLGIARFSIDQIGVDCAERRFDYMNKRYNSFRSMLYPVLYNIGDNSLVVSVTGNWGSQKSAIAKQLADRINFLYVPEPDIDRMLLTQWGCDRREMFNDCVLEDRRVITRDEWLSGGVDQSSTIRYYYYEYKARVHQYRMACMHMLATGQGVVMDGCYWTDNAVMRALHTHKLLGDECVEAIEEMHDMYNYELKRPFLIVHVDRPVDECLRELRAEEQMVREGQSALTQDSSLLEELARQQDLMLNQLEPYSHILRYDYHDIKDNVLTVAEDMEYVDFTRKCLDWVIGHTKVLNRHMKELSSQTHWNTMERMLKKHHYVKEITVMGEEARKVSSLMSDHPAQRKFTGTTGLSLWNQVFFFWKKYLSKPQRLPFY